MGDKKPGERVWMAIAPGVGINLTSLSFDRPWLQSLALTVVCGVAIYALYPWIERSGYRRVGRAVILGGIMYLTAWWAGGDIPWIRGVLWFIVGLFISGDDSKMAFARASGGGRYSQPVWSPDGESLAVLYNGGNGEDRIELLRADGQHKRTVAVGEQIQSIGFQGQDLVYLAGSRLVTLNGTIELPGARSFCWTPHGVVLLREEPGLWLWQGESQELTPPMDRRSRPGDGGQPQRAAGRLLLI